MVSWILLKSLESAQFSKLAWKGLDNKVGPKIGNNTITYRAGDGQLIKYSYVNFNETSIIIEKMLIINNELFDRYRWFQKQVQSTKNTVFLHSQP